MEQIGIVKEVRGETARVEVLRTAMCEGCAKQTKNGSCVCGELLGAARTMTAEAANDARAAVGDRVRLETASSVVLGYAALVFLVPVAAAFLFYCAASAFSPLEWIPWIAAGTGFLLSMVAVYAVDRSRRKDGPQIRITAILSDASQNSESDKKIQE
jgi:positive regulator of sigma E activity